jgi:hypothetical protein
MLGILDFGFWIDIGDTFFLPQRRRERRGDKEKINPSFWSEKIETAQ